MSEVAMSFPSAELLHAVNRASGRASLDVHREMGRGVSSLATIATVAPFLGFLATLYGIVNSFPGCGGQRSTCLAVVELNLSHAIWPTGIGLLVGLIALACHRYLTGRLTALDEDMSNATLQLVNELSRQRGRYSTAPLHPSFENPLFQDSNLAELKKDRQCIRYSTFIAGPLLFLACGVRMLHNFNVYSLTLAGVVIDGLIYVLCGFGLAFLALYPIWAMFPRRRSGWLIALPALVCFAWTVVFLP